MNNHKATATVSLLMMCTFLLFAACSSSGSGGGNNGGNNGNLFDSGQMGADAEYSYTFQDTGTFAYFCRNHSPNMTGSIVVEAGAQSTNPDTVEMIDQQFVPSQLTVAPGTEVIWINRDATAHTVTSGEPGGGGIGY